jgi:hypothetical protein
MALGLSHFQVTDESCVDGLYGFSQSDKYLYPFAIRDINVNEMEHMEILT